MGPCASDQAITGNYLSEVLIARPDLLDATASGGQNVVHLAAAKGDKEVLKAIVDALKHHPSVVADPGAAYDLKLQTMRDVQSARQLRSSFNLRTNSGQTPLMLAARSGHVGCVKFLLDNGADVFKYDKSHQRSVLHYAVAAGQDKVLRYLVSENTLMHTEEGVQPLRSIQVKDISGQCRYIDSRAENGLTALHIAAVRGDLRCVKLLLDAGASMMVRTVDMDMPSQHSVPNGSTPLHLAAQKGTVSIVQAMLQAHADALGNWHGDENGQAEGRRGWEQSTRIDLRSVANALRQLPYHVAWQRGFRQTAQILNPTIAIDIALENVRELEEGFGPQKLSTLAAYCLRRNLLDWLESHKAFLAEREREAEQRAAAKRVIAQQKRKEALQFHRQQSVDDSLAAANARMVSVQDSGHTFSLGLESQKRATRTASRREREKASTDVLTTIHSMANSNSGGHDPQRSQSLGDSAFANQPPQLPERAENLSQDEITIIRPYTDEEESMSSAHTEQNFKPMSKNRFSSASRRFRSSFKKLRPSRPPPPPPEIGPSTSAPAQPSHRRQVSWEDVAQTEAAAEPVSPHIATSCLPNPFSSPFAQASASALPEDDDTELPSPPQMTSHPSGVCLVDPPDNLPLVRQASSKVRLQPSKSRRLSFGKDSKGTASFSKLGSRKSRRLSQSFSRAASIPGFDNNLDSDEDCGICLEETVNVGVAECHHKLCVDCAIKLCQIAKKPPLCPFCRITINAFERT